ncbi:MAG: acyl-ACP thioesterase domain-containing protein [Alphaproteobacteria bacterium]
MNNKYTENKIVKTYQCDKHGFIRPVILMNYLQDVADTHAEILGAGRVFCIEKGTAWVVTHYLVDIVELPRESDELVITTWPAAHGPLKAVRDFEVHGLDGRLMVRATSQWILINTAVRRPIRLNDYLPADWTDGAPRALDLPFDKFPDFAPTEKDTQFLIRYDDVDVNQHVNNAIYAKWATESVGFDFRDTHRLRKIFLNFKKEIPFDTTDVIIETAINGLTSRHKIKTGDIENASIICEWENQ